MLLLSLLLLPLSLATFTSTITLTYTPLQPPSSAPTSLAVLTLSPPTLSSFTPPPSSASLLRLTASSSAENSPSTLVLASALHNPGVFLVLLSPIDNSTISVSYRPLPTTEESLQRKKEKGRGGSETWPGIEIVYPSEGVKPVLNRPVVLNEEGKLPVKEVEKTFLQR
jgi:hypothetical protein